MRSFHGALLQETFDAVNYISQKQDKIPVYLIGFSLGGNFALRIAMKHRLTPIVNLKHVFAISPPLDPYKSSLAIDRYFLS